MYPFVSQIAQRIKVNVYTKTGEVFDLSPHLISGNCKQSLADGCGQFAITLTPAREWLDLIHGMDYLEIRHTSDPAKFSDPPVFMRGFVDNVRTHDSIGGDGRPQASCVINGRNYGKIGLTYKIYYLYEVDPNSGLALSSRLNQNFGITAGDMTPAALYAEVFDKVLMQLFSGIVKWHQAIPDPKLVTKLSDKWRVNSFLIQPYTGSIWNLFTEYQSAPWVELFWTDGANNPLLVARKAPLKRWSDGKYIDANYSQDSDFGDLYVNYRGQRRTECQRGTSDNEAYNYFFVYPINSFVSKVAFKAEAALKQPGDGSAVANPIFLKKQKDDYGFRPLEVATHYIPLYPGQKDGKAIPGDVRQMASEMCFWLSEAYRDNEKWENGQTLFAGGLEANPIGRYVVDVYNGREYYCEGYDFNFSKEAAQTVVQFTRGRKLSSKELEQKPAPRFAWQ